VTVYYRSGYAGPSQTIPAGGKVNLNSTLKNNNASHEFGGPPSGSYGQPRTNPHPAAVSRAPKATARTQFVDNEIARMTGERDCLGRRLPQLPVAAEQPQHGERARLHDLESHRLPTDRRTTGPGMEAREVVAEARQSARRPVRHLGRQDLERGPIIRGVA
jgi:hypothetical protein